MRRQSQRTKSAGRAALLVPLAAALAALAAGCAATGSAANDAAGHSTHAQAGHVADVPETAYLSVVQNYDVAGVAPEQLRYAVTDHKTIAQLAALIDVLSIAPNQNIIDPCPKESAPAFSLDFQDAKGGKVLAQVDFECFGVMGTRDGQDVPILSSSTSPGAPSLLDRVGAILAPYAKHATG
jgi:hypothetical protein